jgi:hypothetical protein
MSLNSKLHHRVLFIFAVSILMISNLAAMNEKSEDGELEIILAPYQMNQL